MCLKLLGGSISREADFKELHNININIHKFKIFFKASVVSFIYNLLPNHINLSQYFLSP